MKDYINSSQMAENFPFGMSNTSESISEIIFSSSPELPEEIIPYIKDYKKSKKIEVHTYELKEIRE